MIQQQMDVFFLEKDHKNNTYKTDYAKKIGTIWPPNPSMGFNDPNYHWILYRKDRAKWLSCQKDKSQVKDK